MTKNVFITGASGCIGHYVLDLFADTPYHLHLLLRNPQKLSFNPQLYPKITLHQGNLEFIEKHADVLRQMDYVMHIATDWSDSDYARLLNVQKTLTLIDLLDKNRCQKIVYFSTASILGPNNTPIPEAGNYGSGYVKSKYMASQALPSSHLYERMVFLYPTLVFGGDHNHPYSHISAGLIPNLHYLNYLRFFYLEGAFHFLHAKDIAQIAVHGLLQTTDRQHYILGQTAISAEQALETLCRFFDKKIWFKFKITPKMIFTLASLLRIQIGPWERFCITHPYMQYDVVNPEFFGYQSAFPHLESLLQDLQSHHHT